MGITPKKNSKNDNKGRKPKEKMALAANKGELIAAIVVVGIFFIKLGYDSISYLISQNTPPPKTTQTANQISDQQRMDLESLNNPNAPGNAQAQTPQAVQQDANNIYQQTLQGQQQQGKMQNSNAATVGISPQGGVPANDGSVDIMARSPMRPQTGKMVTISVAESGRSNPFLPAAENFVPRAVAKLHLPPPPKQVFQNSDAAKIMTTTISGIMYDRYSPSAIININGMDYLVRRGDIVNRYRVLSITPNQVIVQLGNNIYKAGVGQILSLSDINFNAIANLNHKFGGNVQSASHHVKGKH